MFTGKPKPLINYAFMFLDPLSSSPKDNEIKRIMSEKKICSRDGMFCLYAPYKQITVMHESIWPSASSPMWGIGFPLDVISKHVSIDGQPLSQNIINRYSEDLQCYRVQGATLDFSSCDMKTDSAFFVEPGKEDAKKICFLGFKPNTEYKQWWCKGVHKDYCPSKSDNDIYNYLYGHKPYNHNNYLLDELNL